MHGGGCTPDRQRRSRARHLSVVLRLPDGDYAGGRRANADLLELRSGNDLATRTADQHGAPQEPPHGEWHGPEELAPTAARAHRFGFGRLAFASYETPGCSPGPSFGNGCCGP